MLEIILPKDFHKQFSYGKDNDFGIDPEEEFRLLITKEGEWFIATNTKYDVVAQAKIFYDVIYEWQRLFVSRICIAKKLGVAPFEKPILED